MIGPGDLRCDPAFERDEPDDTDAIRDEDGNVVDFDDGPSGQEWE
jgi:hypothetical protein